MSDASSQTVTAPTAPAPSAWQRTRHKWFPIVLGTLALTGWLRHGGPGAGLTVYFLGFGTGLFVLLTLWFLVYGWARFRTRAAIILPLWLALIVLAILYRPINNGSLRVVGWQPRFAGSAGVEKQGLVENWHTTPQDYPRFLGGGTWAEVTGVRLETDWENHPPQKMWRREIGEGWSSFAVVGDYAYTQEQRGDLELVSCYRVDNGELVWSHGDRSRFGPVSLKGSVGGIGPRATPTIHENKIITQGGAGLVSCRDARMGMLLWSHDTVAELGVDLPAWGKSGSPLVVDDMVVVSVGAPDDPAARDAFDSSLVAYDLETGEVRWAAGNRQASFATPVLAELAGERQILVVNERVVTAHRASDGTILWEYPWADAEDVNASVSQPVPLPGDRVFLSKGYGKGASLLEITRDEAGKFAARPLWQPALIPVMKTKMNNVVVRDGYVYGLDDTFLECIALETGTVQWKKRRRPSFGFGQVLLVGDTILVLTETGELVAVEASPEAYKELGSVQLLDPADVTWNNPVFAPPYLLARNAREAVCYRLPLAKTQQPEAQARE